SGHTTQAFGIAVFTALLFRNQLYSWTLFVWASVMAYSRIYLGAHFVSDILGGILAGGFIGWVFSTLPGRGPRKAVAPVFCTGKLVAGSDYRAGFGNYRLCAALYPVQFEIDPVFKLIDRLPNVEKQSKPPLKEP
ncbi:MAG: phosphatase PAP2 family protein, partial [Rikenellaceae bacterium]|nr:phosphatase PAP2 family protein [Rikenellaceae bacterium]